MSYRESSFYVSQMHDTAFSDSVEVTVNVTYIPPGNVCKWFWSQLHSSLHLHIDCIRCALVAFPQSFAYNERMAKKFKIKADEAARLAKTRKRLSKNAASEDAVDAIDGIVHSAMDLSPPGRSSIVLSIFFFMNKFAFNRSIIELLITVRCNRTNWFAPSLWSWLLWMKLLNVEVLKSLLSKNPFIWIL